MDLEYKYRPKNLDEIVGNKSVVKEIYNWFLSEKTRDLIVLGVAGIGKSLTVNLCIHKTGVNAMYFQASDITRKILDTEIKSIVNNFFVKNRIIVIDDIEELATLSIPEIKKAAKVPIIFIGKRINSKVSLKKNQKIEFKKLYKKDILAFIKTIAKAEKIKIPKTALENIVSGNNDLRSMLIAIKNVKFSCKDIVWDKFSLVKTVCQTPMKFEEIEMLVGDETMYIQLLLEENYLNFNPTISQASEIADTVSFNDTLQLQNYQYPTDHGYIVENVVNKVLARSSSLRSDTCAASYSNPYINTLPSRQRAKQSVLSLLKYKGIDRDRIDYLQLIINSKNSKKISLAYSVDDISIIKNLLIS